MAVQLLTDAIEDGKRMKVDDKLWKESLKMLQQCMLEERKPYEQSMIAAQVSIILLLRTILERITDTNNPIEVRLR